MMETAPTNIRFQDLAAICEHYFGEARDSGSHKIFKTPWPDDPRVNIQRGADGKAKPYQVRQVLKAIEELQKRDTQQTEKDDTR